MRDLSPDLKAHLESGATTLCQCWLLERTDGARLGFTDHDEPLVFDGVTYQPDAGFVASEAVSALGLGVTTSEVDGALSSNVLTRDDLNGGVYDNATVTIMLVNWETPSQRIVLRVAELGEVTSRDRIFSAELRGLMHRLSKPQGRLYEVTCDADVGDTRCMVNLSDASYTVMGEVAKILDAQTFEVTNLEAYAAAWFERGHLSWINGENEGDAIEVDSHRISGPSVILRVWLPPSKPIQVGDRFNVRAGCDKLFSTCQNKFSNTLNFRGFPHIPGSDTAFRIARADGRNNGRAIIS